MEANIYFAISAGLFSAVAAYNIWAGFAVALALLSIIATIEDKK